MKRQKPLSFTATIPGRVFPALEHFDGLADKACMCERCVEWRAHMQRWKEVSAGLPNHRRGCSCRRCRMGLRVLYDYRIADNQRDLYCEISYHAATSPEWRNRPDIQEKIMEHIERELEDKSRTSGWWATYAAYYPLSYWIRRVEKKIAEATCTVSGAVSGVFALAQ